MASEFGLRVSAATAIAMAAAALAAAGCAREGADTRSDSAIAADRRDSAGATARADSAPPTRVGSVAGFMTPESVKYDAEQDVYFISNINGNPSQKDNNGFIVRLVSDGAGRGADSAAGGTKLDTLVRGGRNGATLHAPKGMAIVGDTLWVADIDAVRAFNRKTGAAVASVTLSSLQATFLNDVASGPDDALYITDTGIRFGTDGAMTKPGKDRIFRIGADRKATVAIEDSTLAGPNGITWDGANNRFIVVPFSATSVFSWKEGEARPTRIATGPGGYDGVELLADGRILVSSWTDSTVSVVRSGENTMTRLITGVEAPADIGYDTRRHQVLIPRFNGNAVDIWIVR
jgi:sugar lactone lactonase YvrE